MTCLGFVERIAKQGAAIESVTGIPTVRQVFVARLAVARPGVASNTGFYISFKLGILAALFSLLITSASAHEVNSRCPFHGRSLCL